jgi:hypothetical protein
MKLFSIIFLLLVYQLEVFAQTQSKTDAILALEKSCDAGDGLSCAKAAYFHKKNDQMLAYKFYSKGCTLRDESSCFNKASLNPRNIFFKKADGIMHFNAQNISNCHVPTIAVKASTMQYKEVSHKASLAIHINSKGVADSVSVKTDLSNSFVECAKKVVYGIKFPVPEGIDPSYSYELTIMSYK